MRKINLSIITGMIFLLCISFTSAMLVDADYVTIYPGEQGKVTIDIENNKNFDIEYVSIALDLGGKKIYNEFGMLTEETLSLPFTIIGSSEKELDDLDEDDDDSTTFTLKATTDISPGDYNIPYIISYYEEGEDDKIEDQGSFGIRVSAETELDFSVETKDNILGKQGKISLEIINKGLGDLKSVSVEVFPQGFELISKEKVFVGTVSAEDSDLVTFDVIFNTENPILSAKVTYKDFDNEEHVEIINLGVEVYSVEKALELGLISKNNTGMYVGVVIFVIIVWIVYKKVKKARKKKSKEKGR